jgi:tetratricopeptide (TPR) repeat protein
MVRHKLLSVAAYVRNQTSGLHSSECNSLRATASAVYRNQRRLDGATLRLNIMKRLVASLFAILLGYLAQCSTRPTVAELQYEATAAWNSGRIDLAEEFSRRAMAKEPAAVRAQEVLTQIAVELNQPELRLALSLAPTGAPREPAQRFLEIGSVALSLNLARVANDFWMTGLTHNRRSMSLHHRLLTLAGARLDPHGMKQRLQAWCENGVPQSDAVLLYLGIASINHRDASAAEGVLRGWLEADSTDIDTRYGLARCLIAMGQEQLCESVLNHYRDSPEAATLLAVSRVFAGQTDAAATILPKAAPNALEADYWYARGMIAFQRGRWADATDALKLAVDYRPLSVPFRSRYCEALRHQGEVVTEQVQVKQLQTLIRIVDLASQSTRSLDGPTSERVASMCKSIGATNAALIVSGCVPR